MPEQLEMLDTAQDAAHTPDTPIGGDEHADATGGTENDAVIQDDDRALGSDEEVQNDGQANKGIVDAEKLKSEKKISGIQKRLNELTRDKYTERQARENLEKQNRDLLELLKGGAKPANTQTDDAPQQSQFQDYAEFVKADAIYHAVKAADAKIAAANKETAENSQRQAFAQDESAAATAYAQRAAATAKSVPDFEETMADADVDVPTHVLTMIRRLENGPLVAYHMVKNPALAKQFFTQPPAMHGVLLGQLSATLKAPAKVSTAPLPGKTVKSQAGSSSEPPEDTEAYMAWAAKNMR